MLASYKATLSTKSPIHHTLTLQKSQGCQNSPSFKNITIRTNSSDRSSPQAQNPQENKSAAIPINLNPHHILGPFNGENVQNSKPTKQLVVFRPRQKATKGSEKINKQIVEFFSKLYQSFLSVLSQMIFTVQIALLKVGAEIISFNEKVLFVGNYPIGVMSKVKSYIDSSSSHNKGHGIQEDGHH